MTKELSIDAMVSAYRKIREAKQEKDTAYKAEIAELNEQLDTITARLLELFNEQGVESIRTASGTVTRRAITRYWTSDWGSMYEFIKDNDAPYLLEQRINGTNMRQFLDENPDAVPMGLNSDTRYAVTVRKPTSK
jgi:hypothetical protein